MESNSQDEDLGKESNNGSKQEEETISPEVVIEQLKNIAESGNVNIDWQELQKALNLRLATVLNNYIERSSDCKEEQYQEPNVEKFNLDSSKDEIYELIASFTEAPFTIQRICELLYSPFKYYDRISTFLRGLEKNLRVISSNNWPKSLDSSISNNNNSNNNNNNDINQVNNQQNNQELRILPGT